MISFPELSGIKPLSRHHHSYYPRCKTDLWRRLPGSFFSLAYLKPTSRCSHPVPGIGFYTICNDEVKLPCSNSRGHVTIAQRSTTTPEAVRKSRQADTDIFLNPQGKILVLAAYHCLGLVILLHCHYHCSWFLTVRVPSRVINFTHGEPRTIPNSSRQKPKWDESDSDMASDRASPASKCCKRLPCLSRWYENTRTARQSCSYKSTPETLSEPQYIPTDSSSVISVLSPLTRQHPSIDALASFTQ
ncbi:uncharacterized protein PV06_06719 [Exophiala oligosperma]|uniref:Uncharacterized protein n=1 Tax=Exophiala oligosperma TaxID=215243 RepID=A0A0D2BUL0_9EURO|nr:uncharacterized protein PV06_06719 [Exophiala oligosperma]KIW41132.1 hypothetical protein PV06_06719 [Exophiala oligosperma]